MAPVSKMIQVKHLQTAPLQGSLSPKAKLTLHSTYPGAARAGWKGDDPASRTCRPGTSPTVPERGEQGRLREGGKLGLAQVVRQAGGDEASLRLHQDISQQVRLARWGEVPG